MSRYVQSLKSFSYLYQKWVDQITFAQYVQNTSLANTAVRDITLTYTATDPKSCRILNIWPVGVQVSTWQAIHHGIVSRKDLNLIADYPSENRVIADTTSSFRPETLLQPYRLPAPYADSQTVTVQQKIEELKLLLGKFSSPQNAHTILELAKYNLIQGDEQFLNERLEQLRVLDRQS